ncbi:MAG: secretin N-terminal domain-containing protein [Planctomycetota bacterium]|jgi:type IV pilus assembly protein PilQ
MSKVIKKHNLKHFIVPLLMLLCAGPTAFGIEVSSLSGEQGVLTIAQKQLKERVSFTCRNLPIDTVLMQLAEQAKVDIIKSPKVTGNVTVKVTDVPLDEALENILAAHGWTYSATENMVRVMPLGDRKIEKEQEIIEPYIWEITYAKAEDVVAALKDFVSDKGKIAFNKGTNHIIVTDTPSKIRAIDRFVAQIDRQTPQVMVEARVYDITSNEGFEIGVEWTTGRNTPLTTFTDNGKTIERVNSDSLTTGTEPDLRTTVTSDSETEDIETDVTSWFLDDEGDLAPMRKSKPFVGGNFIRDEGGVLRFGLLNDMVNLQVALSLLRSQVEAKLLANPRVLVLDNETANIKIVTEIPYTQSLQTVGSAATVATVQFKNVGVQLQVTPHVARDDMVRLKLRPEFGVLDTNVSVLDKADQAPAVNSRILETIALVKDGQTVVMGGLRKKQNNTTVTKVPLIGDLPLLGGLFRFEEETQETNELVVFITPNIVRDPELSEMEQGQLEQTNFPAPGMSRIDTNRENSSDIADQEESQKG